MKSNCIYNKRTSWQSWLVLLCSLSCYCGSTFAQGFKISNYVYSLRNMAVLDAGQYIWGHCSTGIIQFGKLSGTSRFWSQIDGLPEGAPNLFACDSQQNVWVGYGSKGLWRFNGMGWDSVATVPSLSGVVITCMIAGAGGDMWFGGRSASGGFIARYAQGTWHVTETKSDSGNLRVQKILVDSKQSVWVTGVDASSTRNEFSLVYQVKGDKVIVHRMEDGLPLASTLGLPGIAEDRAGRIWICNDKGISSYSEGKWTLTPVDVSSNQLRISPRSIFVSRDSKVWAYGQGLAFYEGGQWHSFKDSETPAYNYSIRDIIEDEDGNVLAATDVGLYELSGGAWQAIQLDVVPGSGIYALEREVNGGVLVATNDGILHLHSSQQRVYRDPMSLPLEIGYTTANSALATPQGFWTVFSDHGLGSYDGASWRLFSVADGLPNDTLNSLASDPSGVIWVAGKQTLASYVEGKWIEHTIQDSLREIRNFTALAIDSQGTVWTSSLSLIYRGQIDGIPWYYPKPELHRLKNGVWTTFTLSVPLPNDWSGLSCLCSTPEGIVYAAGEQPLDSIYKPIGGLFVVKGNDISQFNLEDAGAHSFKQVRDIHCEKSGNVFVAFSNDHGSLSEFKDESWTQHRVQLGLPEVITAITGAQKGELIVGSSLGIDWVDNNSVVKSLRGADGIILKAINDIQTHASRVVITTPAAISELVTEESAVDRSDETPDNKPWIEQHDDRIIIHFGEQIEALYTLKIVNMLGQQPLHTTLDHVRPLNHIIEVSTRELRSGIYYLQLGENSLVFPFGVLR